MKRIIFLLFAIFFAATLEAQKSDDSYLSSVLSPGFPTEVSGFLENYTSLKSTSLETGIDSLQVLFGSGFVDDARINWTITIFKNVRNFSMHSAQASDSSEFITQELDLKLNNSMKASVKIHHNPVIDEIFYKWMNEDGSSKTASVQKIERPIMENNPMPYFNVKALDGTSLSLDDFKGKYLVINWWQMACRPCIAEMPGLNKLVEKFEARTDVAFIAIAWDDEKKLKNFLDKRDFNYQQALFNNEVASIFGNSLPKHIIVNPQGIVTFYIEGGNADMHTYIEQSLNSQLKSN